MPKITVKPTRKRPPLTAGTGDGKGDHSNREAYLMDALELVRPLFAEQGLDVPAIRVSVGWPGSRRGNRALGSCWRKEASADGTYQVFISPIIADTQDALAVYVHELCHAVTDCTGHGKAFGDAARAVGLEGKLTSTYASKALRDRLNSTVIAKLGQYPHAALNPGESGVKTQSTRLIKLKCPDSGYVARTTRAWLEKYGPLLSPITKKPMQVCA